MISFFFREIDNFQLKHTFIRFSPHNTFFSPWLIFLGKFLNYKSLRLKEYTYFKTEAISTSIESHNADDATKDGSNHVTRGMQEKKKAVHEREI
jgi:hypothetical protein